MKMNAPLARETAAQRYASLSRRHFLRGLGACLALPAFESLRPFRAFAADAGKTAQMASTPTGSPLRMAFVYFPNGAIPANWWPDCEEDDFALNRSMRPLENVKHRLQVLSGLDHVNATPGPDGAGDHARASGTFLTGVRVKKTAGADIHAGISIDQIAANQVGHLTRFPSLELTCDAVRKSGNCDSGYSCAYQENLSWRSPTQPVARQRRQQPRFPGNRHRRRPPLPDPSSQQTGNDRQGGGNRPLVHEAVCRFSGTDGKVEGRGRPVVAAQFHDCLWQRKRRRQSPYSREPACDPRRRRRRIVDPG